MRLGKRKTISIITAFVMAFTVFGCTGLTFAAENQPAQYDRSADDGAGGECRNADLTEDLHGEIALKRGDHDAWGDDIQNDICHHLGGVLRDHALFAADEADGD